MQVERINKYSLTPEEVNRVTFTAQFIDTRQKRPGHYLSKKGYFEEPYKNIRRRDMFWITCSLDRLYLGSFLIEPLLAKPKEFGICRNYINVLGGYTELKLRVRKWFIGTPEYKQQVKWARKLAKLIIKDIEDGFEDTLITKDAKATKGENYEN